MRAILRDDYGSAGVLKLEDVDRPTPREDEVLLRVHASSINMGDRLLMRGVPYVMRLALGFPRPRRRGLGQDVAGRVEAVGSKVADWVVGDEVYGEVTFGQTWAEYVVAPTEKLARKPGNITLLEAGTVPLAGVTALQALRDHGRVQSGQRVLINGGSGSVGSYAVQIARAFGAEVTAVCSGRNADRARKLGATHVIDYTKQNFAEEKEPFDVLLDIAGSRPLSECLKVVKPRGAYVVVAGFIDDPWLQPLLRPLWIAVRGLFAKQRVVVVMAKPSRQDLDALTELIEAGKVVPAFESQCELAELPTVMREIEARESRGKVAVKVA